MQLPKEGNIHQRKENMVCFHTNRKRTESPSRQKDIAQGYEECQHLPLQRHVGKTGRSQRF